MVMCIPETSKEHKSDQPLGCLLIKKLKRKQTNKKANKKMILLLLFAMFLLRKFLLNLTVTYSPLSPLIFPLAKSIGTDIMTHWFI